MERLIVPGPPARMSACLRLLAAAEPAGDASDERRTSDDGLGVLRGVVLAGRLVGETSAFCPAERGDGVRRSRSSDGGDGVCVRSVGDGDLRSLSPVGDGVLRSQSLADLAASEPEAEGASAPLGL